MFTIYGIDGTHGVVGNGIVWSTVLTSLIISLVFYVLRGIGLYVMAKRQNLKNAWLAFVPCAWIYVACKLIGESRFFGKTVDKLAVIFTVIFALSELLVFAYNFIIWFPIVGNFLAGHEIYLVISAEEGWLQGSGLTTVWEGFPIFGGKDFVNPYGSALTVIYLILNIIDLASSLFSLATVIITIWVYINLFKKYWPKHFILAAVLSWMGLFAPLVFALRNREPVDYVKYMNQRYNGWYANGNPYANNQYYNPNQGARYNPGQSSRPEEPFGEFSGKGEKDPGNPFDEFDDKK